MIEDKRVVVAGEAILNVVAVIERTQDQVLEALVRQHSRLVYRIAYAVLRSHPDAEDATQETFIRVLRHSAKLSEVEDAKAWLSRIAWRVAVDKSKQHRYKREVALDDSDAPVDVPACELPADETVHSAEIGRTLETLIAALPAKLREPLILSAIEEMSPREVAGMLNINEAAVRSRIFRARQILKEKLAQTMNRK